MGPVIMHLEVRPQFRKVADRSTMLTIGLTMMFAIVVVADPFLDAAQGNFPIFYFCLTLVVDFTSVTQCRATFATFRLKKIERVKY